MADVKLTKAQQALLDYMVEQDKRFDDQRQWSGGDLIPYYQARHDAKLEPKFRGYATTRRRHAWRRSGGTALMRLAETGAIAQRKLSWGVPQYVVTDLGRELAS